MAEDGYLTSKDTRKRKENFHNVSQPCNRVLKFKLKQDVTLAPVVGRNLALEWGGNHEGN